MSRRGSTLLGVFLLAILAGAGALAYRWAAPNHPVRPDFSLPDLAGTQRSIDAFDGRVVVLNFWASWCAPCREEIPMLVDAQRRWGDQGLQVIGIAVDEPKPAQRFAEAYDINYPVLVDPIESARVQDRYTAEGTPAGVLPYNVVIGRDGRIRARAAGALSADRLAGLVEPLLGESTATP